MSDRFDRRRVMLVADLGRACAVGVIAVLAFTHALTFAALVCAAAAYSVGTAFFTPSFEAIVPAVVHPRDLAPANSLDQFVRPIAMRLAGPALGGWLLASFGPSTAFAVDAVSFLASAAAVVCLTSKAVTRGTSASTLAAAAEGFRFVRSHVWLWATLLVGRDRVSRLPRADRGAAAVRRQEPATRFGGRPRLRVRRRRYRCGRRRGADGATRSAASRRDVHVRVLDDRDARRRRLRPGPHDACS